METEIIVNLITPDDSDTKTITTKCDLTPVYLEQLRSTSKTQGKTEFFTVSLQILNVTSQCERMSINCKSNTQHFM